MSTLTESKPLVFQAASFGRARRWIGGFLNNAFLIFVIFLILAPILWLVQMSVRTDLAIFEMPPDYSQGWTLQNYVDLMESGFARNLLNSVIVSSVSSVISLLIGVPAAYALSRYAFRREGALSFWILSARLALPIGFALPLFNMFLQVGWTNSYQAIIIVYLTFATPLVIWVMRPFLDSIPNDLEESAAVDGASQWQAFTQIVLPLSAPGLVSVGILTFIMTWIEFFYALIFTRGDMMTAPVGVVNFLQYAGWEWGKITTAGVLIMVPVVLFSIFTNKYLISGLTSGAVKG